jgi:hypothetical protein
VSDDYSETESVFLSEELGLMDICEVITLRADAPEIVFEACPGEDSTKIELLYEVNSVTWYKDGEVIPGATDEFYWATETGDYQALLQIGDTEDAMFSETISVEFFTVPVVEVTEETDDHIFMPR